MIFEAIQHILTPARQEVKALGYLREAIAINARYKRCRGAWTPHLKKCQNIILEAATSLPPKSTIMIIGSGRLYDVPMEALLALKHRLILVDIIQPREIWLRHRNHTKIITHDVTGWVRPLYKKMNRPDVLKPLPQAGLVISVNILSQLPLNLVAYAEKHHITLPENFTKNVLNNHLKLITSLAPKRLIISDIERHYKKGDEIMVTESALPEMTLPAPQDIWDWHIAPKGELDKDISLTHQVGCWKIGD